MSASEWRQHWTILPPCIAGIMLCAVHGYSLGVMIPVLEREFGWLRAEISAGPLIISMVALFVAPFIGNSIDRLGPRRIALVGVPGFCLALALLSTATPSIYSWWGLWTLLAFASMFVIPTVWTAAINGYFDKNRGLALALALCGTGLTAAVIPSLTNLLVDGYGWRGAYMALGGICVAVVFPLVWFLFHAAGSRPTPSLAQHGSVPPLAPALTGVSARVGLTSARFLKLGGAATIFAVALCALTVNAVPVLLAQGLTPGRAAAFAGLIGIGSIIGRLCGGYLLDRLDANKVAAVSVLLPIVSIAILLMFPGSETGAALACLVIGLSVGAELDACAYLAARHFGLRNFGTLFGTINGLLLFGNGVAPILANAVYDVVKTYDPVLWSMIPACLLASLLFLWLGPYPVFDPEPVVDSDGVARPDSPAVAG